MKKIYANNLTTLSLGREGENLARQVVFDIRDLESLYGSGTVEVIYQRPGDAQPYPLAVQRDGTLVTWDVTATDTEMSAATANERYGKCELRYYAGETLAKSQIWRTWVESAMDTPSETAPPDPEQGWVEQVLATGVAAQQAADAAKADADRAQGVIQDVNAAGSAAVQSVQSAGDAQVQRVTDEGTTQTANANAQANAAAQSASGAAQSAQEAADSASAAQQSARSAAESAAVYGEVVSDVNQLKQDLSNKLPKSPANWEMWTTEEQAAARARMAVENGADFELLVDATLEEEANTFTVAFPKPVRECIYHIWFYNNNGASVIAQTKCLDNGTTSYYLLKHTSNIKDGYGYALNGYFRYNGPIKSGSVIGYAADSQVASWTTDNSGNGNIAYTNYPTPLILEKVDGLKFQLVGAGHVLNIGATIRVWGR